ncbi:MAG: hypothetical protein WD749_00770 [Phycisphaerales bacterium]
MTRRSNRRFARTTLGPLTLRGRAAAAALAACAGSSAAMAQQAIFWGQCGGDWYSFCGPASAPTGNSWSISPDYPGIGTDVVIPVGASVTVCGTAGLARARALDCLGAVRVCTGHQLDMQQPSHIRNLTLEADAYVVGSQGLLLDGTCALAGVMAGYPLTSAGACTLIGQPKLTGELRNTGAMSVEVLQLTEFFPHPPGTFVTNAPGATMTLRNVSNFAIPLINQGMLVAEGNGNLFNGHLTVEGGSVQAVLNTLFLGGGSRWTGGTLTIGAGAQVMMVPPVNPTGHSLDGATSISGAGILNVHSAPEPRQLYVHQNITVNMNSGGMARVGGFPGQPACIQIGNADLTNAGTMIWAPVVVSRFPGTTQGRVVNDPLGELEFMDMPGFSELSLDLRNAAGHVHQNADINLSGGARIINQDGFWHLKKGMITGSPGERFVNNGKLLRPPDSTSPTAEILVPFDMTAGTIELQAGPGSSPDLKLTGGGDWKASSRVILADGCDLEMHGAWTADGITTEFTGEGWAQVGVTGQPGAHSIAVRPASALRLNLGIPLYYEWPPIRGFAVDGGALRGPGRTTNERWFTATAGALGVGGDGNFVNEGVATLENVTASGTVRNAENGLVRCQGMTVQSGETLNDGVWECRGLLTVQPGALFRNAGPGQFTGDDAYAAGPFDNAGMVVVLPGKTLTFGGPVTQFVNGSLAGGTWVIQENATLVLPGAITAIKGGTNLVVDGVGAVGLATVRRVDGGTLEVGGDLTLTGAATDLVLDNGAVVRIGAGATLTSPGTIRVEPPTAVLSLLKGGMPIADTPAESFIVTPHLWSDGAVIPGDEGGIGQLHVSGNYTQGAAGELHVEIRGLSPGTGYDQLLVSGAATLGGTLRVRLLDEFEPAPGQEFTVLTGASITGTFAALDLPALGAGVAWEVAYLGGASPRVALRAVGACYPNCDASSQPPVLNVADFGCFLTRYAAGEAYANCDGSTQPPVLNVADFGCFLTRYAAGCP